jgi:hypothetical protein
MLFHPRIDVRIALNCAVEAQQIPFSSLPAFSWRQRFVWLFADCHQV